MSLNADATLIYLGKYFDERFGHFGNNSCLFTCIARIVIKETGISVQEFTAKFPDTQRKSQQLAAIIAKTSTTYPRGKGAVKVKVTPYEVKTKADVIASLNDERPVVMMYQSEGPMYDALRQVENDPKRNGIMKPVIPPDYHLETSMKTSMGAHAVLIVGYDVAKDLLLIRDISTMYAYNGYFKVSPRVLGKLCFTMGFTVTAKEVERPLGFKEFIGLQKPKQNPRTAMTSNYVVTYNT